jgi:hypothetical protein
MKYRRDLKLHSSQQSVFYFPQLADQKDPVLSARPSYYDYYFSSLLIEDVKLKILPRGGSANRKSFALFLKPSDSKIEKLIAEAVTQNYHVRNLVRAICGFFDFCAQTIMEFGEAIYEIVYFSRDDGKIVKFRLVNIQPISVIHRRGRTLQYVPPNIARERNVSQYVLLPSDRILTFKPPAYVQRELGGIMESLASLAPPRPPSLTYQELNGRSKQSFLDSSARIRTYKMALAESGKLIGWNARGLFSEDVLEYYSLHRQLLFEKFEIELRNDILSTLNDGLDRTGKEMGFSGKLEIEGLPTLADVDVAQTHLAAGDSSFEEILDSFR